MTYIMLICAALNLWAGWLPTETNTVDMLSLGNFFLASMAAFIAGVGSKAR